MIISIDTELLNQMAALALSANAEIEEGSTRLNMVVEHNDWNCKERDQINDNIMHIKSAQAKLSQSITDYSNAMNRIAATFSEAENALPNEFQHIDVMIGSALSLTGSSNGGGAITSAAVSSIADSTVINSNVQSYEMANLNNEISICDFESFINK